MANPSLKSSSSRTPQDNEGFPTNRGVTVSRIIGQYVGKNLSQILWISLGTAVLASVLSDRVFISSKEFHYRQQPRVVAHCKRIAAVFACFFFPRLADVHSREASGMFALIFFLIGILSSRRC
ncbi:unnamed protein product, partial [Rhizoctonia solani]